MMATAGEAEVEYESDPEEAKLSLKMRRREASDDEEEEEEKEPEVEREKPSRRIESEAESDGEGAAADYDEEEEEEEEYDDEEYVEEEEEEVDEEDEYVDGGSGGGGHEESVTEVAAAAEDADGEKVVGEGTGPSQGIDNGNGDTVQGEEDKKENEPCAVPTAGAFYMHDDRFRDNAGGRHRRTFGGRKLWESKDDRKWGHDKFEELSMDERHYEEGRRASRGRSRGRGRGRGAERGRGRRPKTFVNDSDQSNNGNQKMQNNASKGMRGRGPRRYRPSFKDNIDAPPPPNRQSGLPAEKRSHNSTTKASAPVSNVENAAVAAAKQAFVSSLNSASPPFYPSSSSAKEISTTQKGDLQTSTSSRTVQPAVLGDSSATAKSASVLRGKNAGDSISLDKLNIANPITALSAKRSTGLQLHPGSSTIDPNQSQPLRGQGRGFNAPSHVNYQSPVINNQFNRVSQPTNVPSTQKNPALSRGQPSFQVTGQQFGQRSGTRSQGSSPPKTGECVSETVEIESSSDSSKLKSAMVAKGKGTLQSSGRGSVLYGGAPVMGAPGSMGSGDQNFPAFFPVMQFGGQHPSGIGGVPAVGMAFPGYVGQPQLGLGNSEMTWLPVLAGAAGALGAAYCSPYFSVDGAYHARPSGQMSSLAAAPSKENTTSKPNNESKPQQRQELSNDDLVQRQKNPRRYTEMKFDQ